MPPKAKPHVVPKSTPLHSLLLTLALLFHLPFAQAGSPFYLTAERSYSNSESPTLRLDYTVTEQPMLIRVLKPNKLESFLDGQLNISRSYEEPVSELNPGYYFAKGLNDAESPLKLFRDMIDVDFRKSLQGTAFNKAIVNVAQKPLASVPQQILVAPPKGFQVVRETYLDLQRGGESTQDLGWWFGQDYWSEEQYKVRPLKLDPLPDGVYLVQAVQGKTEAQCLIQVSSLAVQVKQSSEQLLVRVMSRDLQPVAGAHASYRDARGRWLPVPGLTNAAGELSFANPDGLLDGKLVVRVDAPAAEAPDPAKAAPAPGKTAESEKAGKLLENRTALTSTDFLPTQTKDDSVFVLTDRPIFKPGETFHYKGIVRDMLKGQLRIPPFQSDQAQVNLIQANGNAGGQQGQVALTEFGSFSGSFDLDEAQAPGLYRLLAEIDGKPYGGEFRVRDYVKPTFYLELLERSPAVVPGQPFTLKFRATRYSGGAPQNVRFEVFLYRKKFEAPQFVTEAGAGLSAGSDYYGEVKSAAPLTQPQRLFSSIEERQAADNVNPWESAPAIDDNGDAGFEFTVPGGDASKPEQEWIYTLMVRAQDQAGGQAILTENLYATLSEAQPALRFSKTIAAAGEADVKLLLQSSHADGKPAPKAGGVVDLLLEQPGTPKRSLVKLPYATDGQGRHEISVPAIQTHGRISAVATLETLDGRKLSHPASSLPATLLVAGSGGEAVADNQELELYTPSTILSPGEQAKVFALLPKDWGKGERGAIWETVAGARIFDSRSAEAQGRSRWFEVAAKPEYGTGFYHTVTVPVAGGKYREQTLGFRIVPWDKRLLIAIQPEQAEAEPLKPTRIQVEVKLADGKPAADTELALSIVDRAVYAVQAEFRPGIFDFFYPLQRINLSTFHSDDLQGYGYADLLRKPNFALSALKTQSKLAKKAMRDTAGWFPHVLTDAQGRATVEVDMPANVTEWLVTAIAADKEGRVGEITGKFRTVADVSVDLAGPQFLREGDEVALAVKLANHLDQPVKLDGKLELYGPLELAGGETAAKPEIGARGESAWPLRVTAQESEPQAGLRVALAAPARIRVGGTEEFDIPLRPAVMEQVYSYVQSGEVLHTELPEEVLIRSVEVQVSSGLLGAALNSALLLVQYPYGCTEQLVHGTVPNLVLLDLVARAGIEPQQLGALAQPLERARRNAALGIRTIMRNQKSEGGFGLWPGDEASLPVSLIALQAMKFASELQVEGATKSYEKGLEWLSSQIGGENTESLAGGFLLAGLAMVGDLSPPPWQQQAKFVQGVEQNAQASLADLVDALRILQAYAKTSWHGFNRQFKDVAAVRNGLTARLRAGLEKFDAAAQTQERTQREDLYQELGFRIGLPSQISAALGVLNEAGALPPELEARLKKLLLNSRKNGYWTSTYDTAQVILNSRKLLEKEAAVARDGKAAARKLVALSREEARLGELKPIPGGFLGRFTQFSEVVDIGEIKLAGLKPDEVASVNVAVELPYAEVTPKAAGLSVERTFRRIRGQGSEVVDMEQPLRVGDVAVSEVLVKRSAETGPQAAASHYVVIEDGIPSLAEGQEADAVYLADAQIQPREDGYWSRIKETRRYPDRIARVAEIAPGTEMRLYQVWRVARAGIASIPPARAFDMYDESVRGNTEAGKLEVR